MIVNFNLGPVLGFLGVSGMPSAVVRGAVLGGSLLLVVSVTLRLVLAARRTGGRERSSSAVGVLTS
jgi:hypothetical protein